MTTRYPDNAPWFDEGEGIASSNAVHGDTPAQQLYRAVLTRLAPPKVSLFVFHGHLEPLVAVNLTDTQLVLAAPSEFHRDWCQNHYASLLTTEVGILLGRNIQVKIVFGVEEKVQRPVKTPRANVQRETLQPSSVRPENNDPRRQRRHNKDDNMPLLSGVVENSAAYQNQQTHDVFGRPLPSGNMARSTQPNTQQYPAASSARVIPFAAQTGQIGFGASPASMPMSSAPQPAPPATPQRGVSTYNTQNTANNHNTPNTPKTAANKLTHPNHQQGHAQQANHPSHQPPQIQQKRSPNRTTSSASSSFGEQPLLHTSLQAPKPSPMQQSGATASHDHSKAPLGSFANPIRPNYNETALQKTGKSRYTFDNFIEGPANRVALAACSAIIENPGKQYSPLFVRGGAGVGKTHLLQALANALAVRHPRLRIHCVSSEQWVNEYIIELKEKRIELFRRKYRSDCDVLVVDDVHFLARKDASQEEFFHMFNSLHAANKQIVISSHSYPHEMAGLDERLKTRFSWGLVVDLQTPEREMRVRVVEQKAEELGVPLTEEAIDYLASYVTGSTRELEGALNRLSAYAQMNQGKLRIADMQQLIEPLMGQTRTSGTLDTERVVSVVAAHYRIKPNEIFGNSRQRSISQARQVAMYLVRQYVGLSMPEIGRLFGGRDHTTVLNAIRKVTGAIEEKDPLIDGDVRLLSQQLVGGKLLKS